MQHSLAEKQVPAEVICQGKGVTIPAVSRFELPFEIDTPNIIRSLALTEWLGVRRCMPFPLSTFNETFSFKDASDRTWGWPVKMRKSFFKPNDDFLWPPAGMLEPEIDDLTHDFF
jgi:hypothetical protein